MHKLHIQNEKVRSNILAVIEIVRHSRHTHEERKKTISLLLILKTGQLVPLSAAVEHEGVCRPVELHLDLNTHDAYLTDRSTHQFNLEGLDKKGLQVVADSCHYLKTALASLHDIRELAHVEIEPSIDVIKGRSLLHEAWHAMEREDAERFLLDTTPGTYLFRKDRFAGCLEQILAASRKAGIKCFTLTYLDPQGQVRDKTIVQWDNRWLFYDDDPSLSGDYYQSLEDLLFTLRTVLKRPLQAVKEKS